MQYSTPWLEQRCCRQSCHCLRMAWSWKEFAVLMPVLLISVTILILFFYANDGFVDDYELWKCEDEVEELEDEDE